MRVSRYNLITIEWNAEDKDEVARIEEKEAELKEAGYTKIGPARQIIPKSSFMMQEWSRPIYSFTGVGCEKVDEIVI